MTRVMSSPPRAGVVLRYWPAALVAGVVLRVLVVLGTPVFPIVANTWDSVFYHETAGSLASGEGYTFDGKPTAYYPPGYPILLAGAYWVAGDHPRTGQMLNVGLSVLLILAASALARSFLGGAAGRATVMVMSLDPSQIIMPAFLMSEVAGAFLALAASALLAASLLRRAGGGYLAAALPAALAGLVRGHAFLIPLAAAWFGRGAWGRRAALTAMMVVALVDVGLVGAWATRNVQRMDAFIPLATNGGINLWLGNNPNARGGRADPPGGVPQTGDEVQDEHIARDLAWQYMRDHPLRTVALIPLKAVRLLAPAPSLTYRAELREKWGTTSANGVMMLAQLAHLATWAAAGWWWRRRHRLNSGERRMLAVVAGVTAVWTLAHLPFLGGARYLFPVQPFLLLLPAAAWARSLRTGSQPPVSTAS